MNSKCPILTTLMFTISTVLLYGQAHIKPISEEGQSKSNTDTLNVGYTYWWGNSGPFIGSCGDKYALAFLGVVTQIDSPNKDASLLYTPQNGIIEIVEILKKERLEKEKYSGQKYFSSDCFHNTKLKKGNSVLVFCYQYEGSYTIPGQNSIIKINGTNDPVVLSIKKYIDAGENPIKIKEDIGLWRKMGFESDLKRIIECRETF
ncbi:hypothetical protein [Flavivirga algicola]|uniref:Uncharacterized protein n=1 Tax=Flavivirga algicola TaxID=2729136 RepID=A0ABX1S4J1_9FLAO|nr:hypothetical protein [Flavivirga algicola]NMH89359.1 hypothetical protein [Flavivirga algicola]